MSDIPFISLTDFISQGDFGEDIVLQLLIQGKLLNGADVYISVPEELADRIYAPLVERLSLPDV